MDALTGTNGRRSALTRRERQIVEMLARGATGEQIAQELVLSPETVQKHVHNAKRKVGAATRAHLIAIVLTRGLIDPVHEPTRSPAVPA